MARATVSMVGSAVLWRKITAFIPGWPLLIHEFVEQHHDVIRNTKKTPLDNDCDAFPRSVGLLPHLAIADNNMEVLAMLCTVHKLPWYRSVQCVHFTGVQRCVAFFGHLKMLQWLHDKFAKEHHFEKQFECGNLDTVQWFHAHGYEVPSS
ncbi:hypothetical protein FI667_g3652, partial [Globisporangium splendens]